MKNNQRTELSVCRRMCLVFAISMACALQATYAQQEKENGQKPVDPNIGSTMRDPFWPVGYTPSGGGKPESKPATQTDVSGSDSNWNEAMKLVVINGVSSRSDDEYFAVINGEVKSVGDTVSVKHGGRTYSWAVDGIEPPGSVKLRRAAVR